MRAALVAGIDGLVANGIGSGKGVGYVDFVGCVPAVCDDRIEPPDACASQSFTDAIVGPARRPVAIVATVVAGSSA